MLEMNAKKKKTKNKQQNEIFFKKNESKPVLLFCRCFQLDNYAPERDAVKRIRICLFRDD
jgi:hypothetical protein